MPNYNLNYTGAQVNEGIGKAMTALQEHQSLADYRTASAQDVIDGVQNTHIGGLGNAIGMRGWNQLADPMSRGTVSSVGLTLNSENGLTTVSGTSTQANNLYFHKKVMKLYAGHKYALVSELSSSNYFISINYGGNDYTGIFTAPTDTSLAELHFNFNANVDCSCSFHPQLFDLTALFGSGNEPSSVSDFRAMFPADYYPYCSGEFMDLLWTNPNPTSEFAGQTVTISAHNYRFLAIQYQLNTLYTNYMDIDIIPKGASHAYVKCQYDSGIKYNLRNIASSSDTQIVFYGNNENGVLKNGNSVPYKIYGIH